MCDHFYARMASSPEFHDVRVLHPADLQGSRDKLYMFLSGWLGGPGLYVAAYGHPRLRARHMPFPIASRERDQWVACMDLAMADIGVEAALRDQPLPSFYNTADFMRKREG